MIRAPFLLLLVGLTASACAASAPNHDLSQVEEHGQSSRSALPQYNLQSGLALSGYDPVSYFQSDAPVEGSQDYAVRYQGVVYFFANDDHRDAFLDDPARYEPAYGGWCAWAMAHGGRKVDPDPTSYTIDDGVLRVFYRNALVDTRAKWTAGDVPALATDANQEWANHLGGAS